jgi:predicted acyl esterase
MLNRQRPRSKTGLLGASLLTALCAMTTPSVRAAPQESAHSVADSDIPKVFTAPTAGQDYVKREAMIPMRDGVKLHTVIVFPKKRKTRRFS